MRQKGFTLLELLVALAVGSVILTGSLLSLQQVMLGTDRSNSQVVALTDVAQAAQRIREDLITTQGTNLTDGSPTPQSSVTLSWTDYTAFDNVTDRTHISSYALSGTELRRTYDGTMSIVGRNITSLGFTQSGRVINVAITATGPKVRQRTETLQFSTYIRAEVIQ